MRLIQGRKLIPLTRASDRAFDLVAVSLDLVVQCRLFQPRDTSLSRVGTRGGAGTAASAVQPQSGGTIQHAG